VSDPAFVISRQRQGSTAFNAINSPPPVPIFFQKSPDAPSGDVRGISGMDFQATSAGVTQRGTTGADGRIDVRVAAGGSATVQLMFNGRVVAEYTVTVDPTVPDAVTTVTGQQQRLRMLGYHIGHSGTDADGVDGTLGALTESAILDFQADQGILMDAVVGPTTQGRLTTRAGV
jgi:peptidoglycan hydrolase-like protein with peptidoglycan-binding domain